METPTCRQLGMLAAVVLAGFGGCKRSDRESAPKSADTHALTTPESAPKGPDNGPGDIAGGGPGKSGKNLEQSQVQALLDAWVAAQNHGDFAAYSAFYAPSFRGVRRSGDKRVELERDAWLAERERMFKRPMTVSALNPRIDTKTKTETKTDTKTNSAIIDFDQLWEAGNYADVGPKRMIVERVAGTAGVADTAGPKVLITYEEMLSSTRVPASNARLLAMFPDAEERPKEDDVTCEPLDEQSTRLLCLAVTERDGPSVSVDIALLRERETRFDVLDSLSTGYSMASAIDRMYSGDDLGLRESASAAFGDKVEIGPKKYAFAVEFTAHSSIQEEAGTTNDGEATALIAVVGDELIEALRVESTRGGDTDFDGATVESYELLSSKTHGYYNVRVKTERTSHAWPVEQHNTESDTETRKWQPGLGYQ